MEPSLESFESKTILVTGAGGYIGSNLVSRLSQTKCKILRILRKPLPSIQDNANAKIEDIIMDIERPDFWATVLKDVDIVFHLAAQTSVYRANEDPVADHKINVLPTLYLLIEAQKKLKSTTIVFASSCTVYGLQQKLPVDETAKENPITIYELHKILSEQYLSFFASHSKIKTTALRLANVYGPGPSSSSQDRGILNLMIKRALKGEPLTLYASGEYFRDYVYISDVINAFLCAATSIDKLNGQSYIVSTGEKNSVRQAFEKIKNSVEKRTKLKINLQSIPAPTDLSPIETRNFIGDATAFQTKTGWKATTSLSDGIEKTIEAFL